VRHVLLEAEDGPLSEVDWLVDDCSEDLGVVEGSYPCLRLALCLLVLVSTTTLILPLAIKLN